MEKTSSPRWWDLPAAALLAVAILTAATRLVVTRWTDHLSLVQNVVVFGLLAGFALGASRFKPRLAGIFAFLYGLFVVPWQLGNTMGPGILWTERLQSLGGRLSVIIGQLVRQEVVQDSLLFITLMAILFWILSAHAAYTLIRYANAWVAVLPTGLALFVIHSFDPLITRRAWYLAIYIFFTLVLVARVTYLHRYNEWKSSRTALPPHLGLDFIRFTLLATSVVVLLAWTVPALAETLPIAERAWQPVRRTWNDMRDRFDNAFASLRSTVGVVSDYYGSSVTLGRGNELTDTQVFFVEPPDNTPANARLYWRARTYDAYDRGQWLSTGGRLIDFNPQEDNLELVDDDARWLGTFQFLAATPVTTLFTPPQPLWVSRPADMQATEIPNGPVDLSAFRADDVLRPGEIYQVQAAVTEATIAQMRAAGIDYPDWVIERYLQVPDTVTERTKELARRITEGLDTPYDRVVAITTWLRENIEYSETIPSPPPNQEPIDWVLFDLQQGFCNYYATAEVIMLRSIGIPARWSVGYAQGEYLDEDSRYVVRQRDAHAWPEVYFPGLGWVEFEPTASQPVLQRPPGVESEQDLEGNLPPDSDVDQRDLTDEYLDELRLLRAEQFDQFGLDNAAGESQSNRAVQVAIVTGSVALAVGIIFLVWRSRERYDFSSVPIAMERTMVRIGLRPPKIVIQWARWAGLPPLTRSYLQINNALRRLGEKPGIEETPSERADRLSFKLPPAKDSAQKLVTAYQAVMFSPEPGTPDLEDAQNAGAEIRSLSYRAWFRRLFSRLQREPGRDRTPWWKRRQ